MTIRNEFQRAAAHADSADRTARGFYGTTADMTAIVAAKQAKGLRWELVALQPGFARALPSE